MALSSRTYTFTDGTTAFGSQVETEISALSNIFNNLDAATTAWTNVKGATINATTLLKGMGTSTNDNATTGYIGETVSANVTVAQSAGSQNQYINVTSISLTAGDWLVSGQVRFTLNGATITNCRGAVSAFSANTTTDHLAGVNELQTLTPVSAADTFVTIANWRVSIAVTTIIYVKYYFTYSAGTPQYYGNIIGVRIR